jgi:hypothetical protein
MAEPLHADTGHGELLLRAATCRITPRGHGELAGYLAREGATSTGTHDDLEAALVILEAGSGSVAWLALDAIGVTAALTEQLRAAVLDGLSDAGAGGLTADAVMVAASHTHSGPLGWSGSIHPGSTGAVSPAMVEELCGRVRTLAVEAGSRPAEPVGAAWHLVGVPGLGTNRLSPDGPHDDRAGVLTLRRTDGTLAAVVFDFASHPTVLGPGNLLWSADWPGATRAAMREALDGSPVLAFLQGASGDVSSRFTRRAADFSEVERLGGLLAAAVLSVVDDGGRRLVPRIAVKTQTFAMPRRDLPSALGADDEVARAQAALAALAGADLDPMVRIARTRLDGALVQRDLAAAAIPDTIELELAVAMVGDVAWAHVPLELFASIGAAIRSRSPFADTRIVGYANGYSGYLADEAAHAAGSYEALSTYFRAEAAGILTDAVVALLEGAASRTTASEASR